MSEKNGVADRVNTNSLTWWTAAVLFIVVTLLALTAVRSQTTLTAQNEKVQDKENRFDNLVREDFFAGIAGDEAAFDRAMKLCAETLAKNPKHAEAMVWQGSGLLHLATRAFEKREYKDGGELWERGLKEMDDAVNLTPNNVGVLIPRGATLLDASREVPFPTEARSLLEKGFSDYEKVLELQRPYFNSLSVHARGQLLFGLGEGAYRLGNKEKAHVYLERVIKECQGSGLEEKAKALLGETKVPGLKQTESCAGCHYA